MKPSRIKHFESILEGKLIPLNCDIKELLLEYQAAVGRETLALANLEEAKKVLETATSGNTKDDDIVAFYKARRMVLGEKK